MLDFINNEATGSRQNQIFFYETIPAINLCNCFICFFHISPQIYLSYLSPPHSRIQSIFPFGGVGSQILSSFYQFALCHIPCFLTTWPTPDCYIILMDHYETRVSRRCSIYTQYLNRALKYF